MHSWSTFDAQTSDEHTWIQKTHHGPNLGEGGEGTTFPLILFFITNHGDYTQMTFFSGLSRRESRNSQNWDSCHFD